MKYSINMTVRLVIDINDNTTIGDVVDELDYSFNDTTGSATIIDSVIEDFEVEDVK